jgi:uncharacterized protein YndB with AHSA1/START domain
VGAECLRYGTGHHTPTSIRDVLVTPGSAVGARRFPSAVADDGNLTQRTELEIDMVDIVHRVGIKAPASKVYAALSSIDGLAGWWSESTRGDAKVGGTLAFRFFAAGGEEIGGFDMDVLELAPERKVRWRVKEGPQEWIGTDIEFSLSRQDDYTIVMFGHRNWREEAEFMSHCSTKWATFLLSLRDLVETGKGRPAPHDLKIGNWH